MALKSVKRLRSKFSLFSTHNVKSPLVIASGDFYLLLNGASL